MKTFEICIYNNETNQLEPQFETQGESIESVYQKIQPTLDPEDVLDADYELVSFTETRDDANFEISCDVQVKPAEFSFIERYKVVEKDA